MDSSGYPDGVNAQFYAVILTKEVDLLGLKHIISEVQGIYIRRFYAKNLLS